jgi:uncharacterized protein
MTLTGRRRVPFTEFVLKINDACNLACTYCYMFESIDAAPRAKSAAMPRTTAAVIGDRIAEHATKHGISRVRLVLHGGEPLLSGADEVAWIATELRNRIGPGIETQCALQTNALLLSTAGLARLRDAGIRVGVSLDGSRAANDRHRLFRDGRSSYDRVLQGLRLLRAHPESYAGILSVIDLASDPIETYEALLSHAPPAIDFLLPHGNWVSRPPGRPGDDSSPYGDWLTRAFDRWYDAPRKELSVRLFEEIINGLLGGSSTSESIGLSPVGTIVIGANGALEQVDALRTTFRGARETGLNVFEHPFDIALDHEAVVARQSGLDALSQTCLECPLRRVCGGGYYPHRYGGATGFRNPSVYCADLRRLIEHIDDRVRRDVARIVRQTAR